MVSDHVIFKQATPIDAPANFHNLLNCAFAHFSYLDIYITMVSSAHAVCAQGLRIAIVSTTVETENPEEEIQVALNLLGPLLEMFVSVSEIHSPVNDAAAEALYITTSYDATSHFQSSSVDVLNIYE